MTQDNPQSPEQPSSDQTPPPGAAQPIDYAAPVAGAYVGPEPSKDDKTMAMLAHLLAIVAGFIGPLIIWLIKKDQSPFVDDQGKEALNFQLTLLIGYLVAGVLTCVVIGAFIIPVLIIIGLVFAILGAVSANKGVAYRYPLSIRFIK